VKKKILNLIGLTLAFGAAVAFASRQLWPDMPIPLYSLVAAGLCLVPAVVTLIWASRGANRLPEDQLLIVLGGIATRMLLVLGVGLALYYTVSTFGRMSFLIVVLIFYLFTLGIEVILLVSGLANQEKGSRI